MSWILNIHHWLVVWNMLFHILGIIIPTGSYFSEGLKPPTRSLWDIWGSNKGKFISYPINLRWTSIGQQILIVRWMPDHSRSRSIVMTCHDCNVVPRIFHHSHLEFLIFFGWYWMILNEAFHSEVAQSLEGCFSWKIPWFFWIQLVDSDGWDGLKNHRRIRILW